MTSANAEPVQIKELGEGGKEQLFNYVRVQASNHSRLISHPVESGGRVFDNKVIDPSHISVDISVEVGDKTTIDAIFEMFTNRAYKFYEVQTRTRGYKNLSLEAFTYDDTPDVFNRTHYRLQFKEILFYVYYKKPFDPDNFQTRKLGNLT